ncbi:hypothetical protein [Pseudoxanthomonas suwonensis]|uniref:hypothetical protein n=1 Tax=Pseudoxanthomonas suwonensis TaxID=314722 RepID=UPI000464FBE8|nr:hypothetical protein [Pseudoxanthomonas suwonensis]
MKYLPIILVLEYPAILVLGLLFQGLLQAPVNLDKFLGTRFLLPMLLVMPFMETAIIHSALTELALKLGRGSRVALYVGVSLSGLVFFALHLLMNGAFNGLVYGLTGGITLSIMYALARKEGAQRAFFATWMLHLCSNALAVLSMAFYGMALGVR